MGLIDYHIHTHLCCHAAGEIDDYINEAIKSDILEIGFADHAPLPEGLREGITMLPEEAETYIDLVLQKRSTYLEKLQIKLGFEVDFPIMDSLDRRYLSDARLDYLIGSCHFLGDWAFDNPYNVEAFDERDIDEVYKEYYLVIQDLVNSGHFNILGHFDLVKKFGHRPKSDLNSQISALAKLISKGNMAVEINTAGLRWAVKEIYPSKDIVEILFNENVPVTLGSDAHSPDQVGYMFDEALDLIKGAGYRKISGFEKRKRYDVNI